MNKLMRVAYTSVAPKGLVISGTNPDVQGLDDALVVLALHSVQEIEVRANGNAKCNLTVNGLEMTTSVGGGRNLHFLVDDSETARCVADGDEIFGDIQESVRSLWNG